jgi:pimeloyl-ACP methyl ester carboxylesterase
LRQPLRLAARELEGPKGPPPLLVLHGLFGSQRNWQAHGKALARERRVFLVDLRNHGYSPWSDVMDYPAMAADVAALAERNGLERVSLLGHSMGGKVAMTLALDRPALVDRLIVADIAPVAYSHDFDAELDAMRGLDLASVDRRSAADAAMAAALPNGAVRQFLLQNLDFDDGGKAHWRLNLAVLQSAIDTLTGWPGQDPTRRFDGPALAVRGEHSPYVDEAGRAALRRLFPGVEMVTIPAVGHWLHVEAPRPFLGAVQRFLDS